MKLVAMVSTSPVSVRAPMACWICAWDILAKQKLDGTFALLAGLDLLEENLRLEVWDAAQLEGKGMERLPKTNPSLKVTVV